MLNRLAPIVDRKRHKSRYAAPTPWHRTKSGRGRLEADAVSLREIHRTLDLHVDEFEAYFYGTFSFAIGDHGIVRTAPVAIWLPPTYPENGPVAYVDIDTFEKFPDKFLIDRHLYRDGECCLEITSSWRSDRPYELKRWVNNFVTFVHRQFLYDLNGGKFPGHDWKHGNEGRVQLIEETLETSLIPILVSALCGGSHPRKAHCPCGSGKAYGPCHKRKVASLVDIIPSKDRNAILEALAKRYDDLGHAIAH